MIRVEVTKTVPVAAVSPDGVERIVRHVCRKQRIRKAELSFVFVDDAAIRTINRKFLRHDYVTDVITFPLEQDEINGEIYINALQAKRQAAEHGVTLRNEVTRLVVHGTLHALGYDDTSAASKRAMETLQERYVSELS